MISRSLIFNDISPILISTVPEISTWENGWIKHNCFSSFHFLSPLSLLVPPLCLPPTPFLVIGLQLCPVPWPVAVGLFWPLYFSPRRRNFMRARVREQRATERGYPGSRAPLHSDVFSRYTLSQVKCCRERKAVMGEGDWTKEFSKHSISLPLPRMGCSQLLNFF